MQMILQNPYRDNFCWESDSIQQFKDALRSWSTQILIREFLNGNEPTTNVNTSLEKVEHILIATAKRCLKIESVKRHKCSMIFKPKMV